jgi:large subunit ribosomal protein L25
MKTLELKGSLRTETGKKFAKRMRRNAEVPAIIYGGKQNIMISLIESELRELIFTPNVYIINLNVEGKNHKAILKEVQFHPVSDKVLHIDFIEISETKKITISIPIELTGVAEGVKTGGKLALITRNLKVSALPKHLPDTLKVDITDLVLGKSRLVNDIEFPNITILDPKSTVIASVKMTRAARGAQAAAEGETPAK